MSAVDYNNDPDTVATLGILHPVSSLIDFVEDSDWFKAQLIAGVSYSFHLESSGEDGERLQHPLLLGLYDSTGALAQQGSSAELTITVAESGDYFIAAGTADSGVGAYQLSMTVNNVSIENDLILGDSTTGELSSAEQVNAHKIMLMEGSSYTFRLENNGSELASQLFKGLILGDDDTYELVDGITIDENDNLHFSPSISGAYFLLTGAVEDRTGSYRVLATPDIVIEDSRVILDKQSNALSIGIAESGEIDSAYNRDLYRVWLGGGQEYQIDMEGRDGDSQALGDAFIYGVYNPHGVLLAGTHDDDSGDGYNARVRFTPTESGFHYVSAGAYHDRIGNYQLLVNEVRPEVVGDDFGLKSSDEIPAGLLLMNTSQQGSIEVEGDTDAFQFTVRSGYRYQVDVEGVSMDLGGLVDPNVEVGFYDEAGNWVSGLKDDDGGEGLNARLSGDVDFDASLYLKIGSSNSSATGAYKVTITETLSEPVIDDRAKDSSVIGVALEVNGEALIGSLEKAGDEDWFPLTITEVGDYRIDITGDSSTENWIVDPRLKGVYHANGDLVTGTRNDDGGVGLNARIEWFAEPGDYFIAVDSWSEQTGMYKVAVSSVLPDDYGQDSTTIGVLGEDGMAEGVIEEPSDQDWFRVSFQAGYYYQVGFSESSLRPSIVGIYDSDGRLYLNKSEAEEVFIPEETADYFIAVEGDGFATGSYQLSVESEYEPDHLDLSAGTDTLGVVTLNSSVNGRIGSLDDEDWFRISLQPGQSYHISLEGTGLKDPLIEGIYNSTGRLQFNTYDDDNGEGLNSALNYIPFSSADHFIAVKSSDSEVGDYKLTVTINSAGYDDLSNNVRTTGSVKVEGASLGRIEQAGDKDWFKMSLDAGQEYIISMEGNATYAGNLEDPVIEGIYDENGVLIDNTTDDDGGFSVNALVHFTPEESGDYYIEASAFQDTTGSYTVKVNQALEDVIKSSISGVDVSQFNTAEEIAAAAQIGSIVVGDEVTGVIENMNDRDWFAVSLSAGERYRVSLSGSDFDINDPFDALSDTYIYGIYNHDGSYIFGTENDDKGDGSRDSEVIYTPYSTDIYYISVGGFDIETGSYILSIV